MNRRIVPVCSRNLHGEAVEQYPETDELCLGLAVRQILKPQPVGGRYLARIKQRIANVIVALGMLVNAGLPHADSQGGE